jgi:hypothetical protein
MEYLRRRLEGEDSDQARATATELAQDGHDGSQNLRGRFTRLLGEQFLGRRPR